MAQQITGSGLQWSVGKTPHDHLPLPRGRKVADLNNAELVFVLRKLGVPNVSDENGRTKNAEAYGNFVEAIKHKAAEKAFKKWLDAWQ